jgi:hypothetical protein
MLPKVMQPRSGLGELLVKRLLAAIARPVAAIERERGVVEDEPPRAASQCVWCGVVPCDVQAFLKVS